LRKGGHLEDVVFKKYWLWYILKDNIFIVL
jgi:hypothetical protein